MNNGAACYCKSTHRLRYWNALKVFISAKKSISSCCNSTYRLRYWNCCSISSAVLPNALKVQQHLLFTVCAEGCEAAEKQSDDEVRTSQVPERSEGKTKAISNSTYRLRYWNSHSYSIAKSNTFTLQQHLPLAVCAAECEAAEERSDDEDHTLLTWTKRR